MNVKSFMLPSGVIPEDFRKASGHFAKNTASLRPSLMKWGGGGVARGEAHLGGKPGSMACFRKARDSQRPGGLRAPRGSSRVGLLQGRVSRKARAPRRFARGHPHLPGRKACPGAPPPPPGRLLRACWTPGAKPTSQTEL